tara:strand:- start:307 stop:498 length:192 start_codon:yes stop_codon:yes gene_type:complete
MDTLIAFIGLSVVFVVYFLPSIIATKRNHKNRASIYICNFFGIVYGITWIAAIIWCFSDDTED